MPRAKRNTCLAYFKAAIEAHGDSDECLEWPFGKHDFGYGSIFVDGQRVSTHRYAFFYKNGRWPHPLARHTCDNPPCFNPRHIIEGTKRDNLADAKMRGRNARGSTHGHAKLTDDDIRKIRSEYSVGRGSELAAKYRVCNQTIYNIVNHKNWSHVTTI